MKVSSHEIPYQATPEDYQLVVSELKNTQFRYFFAVISDRHYEGLMKEAFKQGIAGTGKHNWIFSDAIYSLVNVNYEKDSPLYLSTRGTATIRVAAGRPSITEYDKFFEAFKGLNNEENIKAMTFILQISSNFSNSIELDDNFFDDPGVWGAFFYDTAILIGLAACEATKSGKNLYLDGQTHYNAILNTSFEGTSGNVILDPKTGSRVSDSAIYSIYNTVEDNELNNQSSELVKFSAVETNFFKNGKWFKVEPFIFNDGTSTIPLDLPTQKVDMNYYPTALRAVCWGMSGFIILLSVGFLLWTYIYNGTHVVKASQPIFLNIICYGTILMAASIIPRVMDDQIMNTNGLDVACMSIPWLGATGFTLSFAALQSKTMRVNKIFNNPAIRRIKVLPRDVIKPMLILLSANILVLSLWTALSPLEWERKVIDVDYFERTSASVGMCTSAFLPVYAGVVAIINTCPIMLALYQAYQARHISTEFAESTYIAAAMCIMLAVAFIGIPVLFIAYDNKDSFLFVSSGIIFVICVSLLLLIFLPKIKIQRSNPSRNNIMKAVEKNSKKQKN